MSPRGGFLQNLDLNRRFLLCYQFWSLIVSNDHFTSTYLPMFIGEWSQTESLISFHIPVHCVFNTFFWSPIRTYKNLPIHSRPFKLSGVLKNTVHAVRALQGVKDNLTGLHPPICCPSLTNCLSPTVPCSHCL